jgi:hypothetical protein
VEESPRRFVVLCARGTLKLQERCHASGA